MVLEEKPIFNKCLINFSKNPSPVKKMLATEQEQSENTTDDKNETRPLQPDGLEKADDTLDISKKNNIELTIVDDPVEENTPTDTNENITTSPELINDLGEKVNTDNKEEAIEHVSDSLETLNTSSINNLAENDTFENENIKGSISFTWLYT